MKEYRRNHYVPEWYQYRFFDAGTRGKRFCYLNLNPATVISRDHKYVERELQFRGPPKCFCEDDLYTTRLGQWESTEIEQKFFGNIDYSGRKAVQYFSEFQHPSANPDALHWMLLYMSTQKLRTPKGLGYLSQVTQSPEKNSILIQLQRLQQMHCAIWMECIWSIADASESDTKFIISDHPVTVYNKACFPLSKACRGFNDPEIWLTGTHTLFPLSLDKILILTNLSWVRDPWDNPIRQRPNSILFRDAVFNFMQVQTGRKLSSIEVSEINYIIKKRAFKFVAASNEEWLYPEEKITTNYWDKLGNGYLLMPDPRSVNFSSEIIFGYGQGRAVSFDSYGHKPWQRKYDDKERHDREWISFHAFRGEFARIFGPKRRGLSFQGMSLTPPEDSPEYHSYHLKCEQKYKTALNKMKR